MRQCSKCGCEIEGRRAHLPGVTTCHRCGEAAARVEIANKAKRIAPDGNKQGLSYQGDNETARRNILQAGKKYESISQPEAGFIPAGSAYRPPAREMEKALRPQRRQVGLYYLHGEARVWWDNMAHPRTLGATRWAHFEGE